MLRLGLGHGEQAQVDLRRFERLYRRTDVGRAAKLFWSQRELLEDDEARRTHALEYLKSYGREGGLDRALVAEAVIGQIDWRRSCPEPLLHDSCITITRPRIPEFVALLQASFASSEALEVWWQHKRYTPPKRCGVSTNGIVQVHERDPKLAAAAQARFEKVLSLARNAEPPADDPERVAAFRAAWGMAIVYTTDEEYEQWLRLDIPEALDFFVEEWRNDPIVPEWYEIWRAQDKRRKSSKTRLDKFMANKRRVAEDLQASYAKVDETHSPAWMLAAAARIAAIHQHFAEQLLRAPVPQSFTDPDHMWAFCDELADRAEPIFDQALAAYRACLDRSTELQYDNEFSRMCAVELQQLDILSPATHELFGEPIVTSSRIASLGLIAEP